MSIFLSCPSVLKEPKCQNPWPHYGNSPLHEASFRSLLTHAPGLHSPLSCRGTKQLRQVSHDVRFLPLRTLSGAICLVRAFGH